MKVRALHAATVGAAENGNSAVLVTIATGGELLDRRLVDLTRGLPTHPYHHEGSWAVGRYLNSSWSRPISWYDREHVFRDATAALGGRNIDAFLQTMGRFVGPPWQAKHKLAAAAALAAGTRG